MGFLHVINTPKGRSGISQMHVMMYLKSVVLIILDKNYHQSMSCPCIAIVLQTITIMTYRHKPHVDGRNTPQTAAEMQTKVTEVRAMIKAARKEINSNLPDYVITGEELLNL